MVYSAVSAGLNSSDIIASSRRPSTAMLADVLYVPRRRSSCCDTIQAIMGHNMDRPESPSTHDATSAQADWSPGLSSRVRSLDDLPRLRSAPEPLQAFADELQLQRHSPVARDTAAPYVPPQPQVLLDLGVLQAQAEQLESEACRDIAEAQRMAQEHVDEMLDSKGVRVSHACEHCRARKAKVSCSFEFFNPPLLPFPPLSWMKRVLTERSDSFRLQCSGQQPCQRCSRQSILCTYQKSERTERFFGPTSRTYPVHVQAGTSQAPLFPRSVANLGPIRAEKGRESRHTHLTVPYGPRRNTVSYPPPGYVPSPGIAGPSRRPLVWQDRLPSAPLGRAFAIDLLAPPTPDAQQNTLPWTTGSTLHPGHASAPAESSSSQPPWPISQLWERQPRRPPTISTLDGAWTASPAASSSSNGQEPLLSRTRQELYSLNEVIGLNTFEDNSPHTWSTEANASADVLLESISTETDLLSHRGDAGDKPEFEPYTVESPDGHEQQEPAEGDGSLYAGRERQQDTDLGSYDVDQL